MVLFNSNYINGRFHSIMGTVKELMGEIVCDQNLINIGSEERIKGHVLTKFSSPEESIKSIPASILSYDDFTTADGFKQKLDSVSSKIIDQENSKNGSVVDLFNSLATHSGDSHSFTDFILSYQGPKLFSYNFEADSNNVKNDSLTEKLQKYNQNLQEIRKHANDKKLSQMDPELSESLDKITELDKGTDSNDLSPENASEIENKILENQKVIEKVNERISQIKDHNRQNLEDNKEKCDPKANTKGFPMSSLTGQFNPSMINKQNQELYGSSPKKTPSVISGSSPQKAPSVINESSTLPTGSDIGN